MRSVLASLRRRKLKVSYFPECFCSHTSKVFKSTQMTTCVSNLPGQLSVHAFVEEPPFMSHRSVWNIGKDDYQQKTSYPSRSRGHVPARRTFATAWSGADLAQRILASSTAKDIAEITTSLTDVNPSVRLVGLTHVYTCNFCKSISSLLKISLQALPAVARAAAVTAIEDRDFRQALLSAAIRGLPSLSAAEVCSVVESMADLGAYSLPFKDATANEVLSRMEEFSGDMLGHTLRAFGTMEYYDDDLLDGVITHISKRPEKFTAENIADVVFALSKCGFCHPDLVSIVQRAGDILLKEAAHDQGEAIVSIVDAYSRVGCDDSEIVDGLIARVAEVPETLSGEALSRLIVACITLGCEDSRLLHQLLQALTKKVDDLSPKSIVATVSALGELGLCHTPLLDAITNVAVPSRLQEFKRSGLQELVNSLNKLGYYNQSFMQLIQ